MRDTFLWRLCQKECARSDCDTKYEWISNMKKLFENWRNNTNEELRDYVGGQSRSPDLQIPGYGIMTVEQVERKLARMLQEAAEDAMKDPPQYSHLNNGVIQALHKALKDFKEL